MAKPKLTLTRMTAKQTTGTKLRLKLLGNRWPVALSSTACGMAVSNTMTTTTKITSTNTMVRP